MFQSLHNICYDEFSTDDRASDVKREGLEANLITGVIICFSAIVGVLTYLLLTGRLL